jgi:uncharacterized protein YqjF (DUF2071 family)
MQAPPPNERVFLSAEWRDLVILNYEIRPELVAPLVPDGTQLDFFDGKTYVSLVGFRFRRTKLLGFLPIPFHANFDEVNLRFYVRHGEGSALRRGVVFIREIVPRLAIAQVARLVYGENYTTHPMRHSIRRNGSGVEAEYQWEFNGKWCRLHAQASGTPMRPSAGSLQQFITEHYWGYTARRGGQSIEYHVTHEPWRVWTAPSASFEGDSAALYGPGFGEILRRQPDSAFIAEGSPVLVSRGRDLP